MSGIRNDNLLFRLTKDEFINKKYIFKIEDTGDMIIFNITGFHFKILSNNKVKFNIGIQLVNKSKNPYFIKAITHNGEGIELYYNFAIQSLSEILLLKNKSNTEIIQLNPIKNYYIKPNEYIEGKIEFEFSNYHLPELFLDIAGYETTALENELEIIS